MTERDEAFEAWRQEALDADILSIATSSKVGAKLKKKGVEWVGACPRCSAGKKGSDRFAVNTTKQKFNCRGAAGGKVISMVMHTCAVSFLAACEIITGKAPPALGTQLTPEQRAASEAMKKESADREARREADENAYRATERETLFEMERRAHPFIGSSAAEYMMIRGLTFPPTQPGRAERIKCIESMPYYVHREGQKKPDIVHRGPVMAIKIVDRHRKFRGLHLTYLDLGQAKGKLVMNDPKTGEPLDPKKTRGSMKGNHSELIGPIDPVQLFLGEGNEKVVGVHNALVAKSRDIAHTAFWSGLNLGNMAGPAADGVWHPTLKHEKSGRPVKIDGATPDFAKPGIVIPDSVTDLILLGDSTSEPLTTQLAMARAAARYAAPGRRVRVAWAPAGIDFDDPWRDRDPQAADLICAIIDAAGDAPDAADAIARAAPARDSAPAARRKKTGAGDAGAPTDLPPALPPGPESVPYKSDGAPDEPYKSDGEANDGVPRNDGGTTAAASAGASDEGEESTEGSRTGRPGSRAANRARWRGPPAKYGNDGRQLDRWLAFFPQTELGLIERYVQREKHRLRYCAALGWLKWDGKRWARDAEGDAIAAGHDTVRQIMNEADAIRGTELDELVGYRTVGKGDDAEDVPIYLSDTLESFSRGSETKSKMTMHEHAIPYLSVKVGDLDADKMAINVLNGTLIVRRNWSGLPADGVDVVGKYIRFKPHDPQDFITKIANVEFRRNATCPKFDVFMNDVQPEAANQSFLDDWYGYSLTGDATEQKLVFDYGTGKNGKSTALAVRLAIAGDYGRPTPIETFINEGRARGAGQATPDLAMLRRVRLCATSEPEKGWKLNEGLIKALTGGDTVPVRELHKAYFDLIPEFKITIAGNFRPNISGGEAESGIWRRVVLVPWKIKIAKDKQDPHLVEKLKAEASGIFNRWLRGLSRWMERALVLPDEVRAATEQFRIDSDPLGRFLDECTKSNMEAAAQTTVLYNLFVAWSKAAGEVGRHQWSPTGFGKALAERGYVKVKNSTYYWRGLEIVKKVSDYVDDQGEPLGTAGAKPGTAGKSAGQAELKVDDAPREGF